MSAGRICGYKWDGSYGLTCICTLPKGHPNPNKHSGEVMDKNAYWAACAAKFGAEHAARAKTAYEMRIANEPIHSNG